MTPHLGERPPRRRSRLLIAGSRWRSETGQSLPEYVTVVGVTAATVILCVGLFVGPVARTYVALFRRLVLYLTSVP